MTNMIAENSASSGEAYPMLLARAPRNEEMESLITTPIEPHGWLPTEDPSQLNLTTPLEGGFQYMICEGVTLLTLKGMLNSLDTV